MAPLGCGGFTVQRCNRTRVWGRGLSEPRRPLAVVVGGLHLEDVGDDAVDLHVPDEAGEEELLCDGGADEPEGRETQQQLGQPGGETKCCRAVRNVRRLNCCRMKLVNNRKFKSDRPIRVFRVGGGDVVLQLGVRLLLKPLDLCGVINTWVIWWGAVSKQNKTHEVRQKQE